MDANSILLNRMFTQNTIYELIHEQSSSTYENILKKYVPNFEKMSNKECICKIYSYFNKQYRNEYFYKNTLLNKLLLGVHSVNTTTALTEVPVGKSKADFILINGKAVVYEIKTDLDNLERLSSQINDYYKAFSRVVVVTSESNYSKVFKRLEGTPVGIYVLTSKSSVSRKKEPIENLSALSKESMFKILRKKEYEDIIKSYYGKLPNVSSFEYYSKNKELFLELSKEEAYSRFIKEIKRRSTIDKEEYSKVPYELKFLMYFSKCKKNDYLKLTDFLNR